MRSLSAVDLGLAKDSIVNIEGLDSNAIRDLLNVTNQEHKEFLLTDKDRPIAAIIPLEEFVQFCNKKDHNKNNTSDMYLEDYETELDHLL